MDEQELNRKLAEWAGFKYSKSACDCNICKLMEWIAPDAKIMPNNYYVRSVLPDFTQSLDACFKWLVPQLNAIGFGIYRITQYSFHSRGVKIGVLTYQGTIEKYMDGIYTAVDREPALALCLAIEKLIDRALVKEGEVVYGNKQKSSNS